MSNQNLLGNDQALNSFLQQQTKHIEGQPVRVYPFKIVSGLSYFTNRGQKPLGSNIGETQFRADNTSSSKDFGGYTGATTIFSGSKPIIAYWFGVLYAETKATNPKNGAENCIHEWINAVPIEGTNDQQWEPQAFTNPITNQTENPWKECGLVSFSVSSGKERHSETLDNLKVACYETTYSYVLFSNDWVPTFQEINEFVYFIIDIRCASPIALRIDTVEPHYDNYGILQDCQITFESVNQYFNQTGRNVLTYVKFGAVGDGYPFPEEIIQDDGTLLTRINMNLLNPKYGGVSQVAVKNNSLTGQFGGLIYGHAYKQFNTEYGLIRLEKYTDPDRYLLPYQFVAPMKDMIDVSSEVIASSYDLMLNMLLINEQIWGNWKSTKEYYNLTQNWTFQGGLAFNDPLDVNTSNVLYGASNTIFNGNMQYTTWTQNNPDHTTLGNGYGSKNLAMVMMSNSYGYGLDFLSDNTNGTHKWTNQLNGVSGYGFYIPTSTVFDYRGTYLTVGQATNPISASANYLTLNTMAMLNDWFDLYYANGFQPPSDTASEILAFTNYSGQGSFILPQDFYVLNSFSMINVHQLEINYRDGIVYTNKTQGQDTWWNKIEDSFAGISDYFMGYTPGYANFFQSTYARTYSLMIPHSLAPLCNQYLNPNDSCYNAIPLDIFANTNDNNTSVGQLKYMSGYQFILTDQFLTTQGNLVTTAQMRGTSNTNLVPLYWSDTSSQQSIYAQAKNSKGVMQGINVPNNSITLYKTTQPPEDNTTYIIDEINIKQLGISNIHITYYVDADGVENTVGEEWLENTAKMMNNTSYIDNDIQYYVYDEYNTTIGTNSEPYIDLQYPPDPIWTQAQWKKVVSSGGTTNTGMNYIGLASNSTVVGVNFTSTYANDVGTLAGDNPISFFSGYENKFTGKLNFMSLNSGAIPTASWSNSQSIPPTIFSMLNIQNSTNNIQFVSANSNSWWLNECSGCSTNADSDGYLPGYIHGFELDGFIGGLSPFTYYVPPKQDNALSSYPLTSWPYLEYGQWQGTNYPSFWSVESSSYSVLCQPYAFTMQYYTFNISSLISQCSTSLASSIPSPQEGSGLKCQWNYVLIPASADPSDYLQQWAYSRGDKNIYPWCDPTNAQNCVILIEPKQGNNPPSVIANTYNNIPCYLGNYNGGYRPCYYLGMVWWNNGYDVQYSYETSVNQNVVQSLTYEVQGGFNTYEDWTNFAQTLHTDYSEEGTGLNSGTYNSNNWGWTNCPYPIFTNIGMGASFVGQYVVETSGSGSDTMRYNYTATCNYTSSPNNNGIPTSLQTWLSTTSGGGAGPNGWSSQLSCGQSSPSWIENQSTFLTAQSGKYKFYVFYNIYNPTDNTSTKEAYNK